MKSCPVGFACISILAAALLFPTTEIAAIDIVLNSGARVLPGGQKPNDVRLQPLKDLEGYFPFSVPATVAEWNKRSEFVRRQILVSQGIWPLPTKTPLMPVIHGRIERDDYTIEKVYFESVPGHFVTGNLYRPKGRTGKLPAVLCPHGHWANGRFYDQGEAATRREIANGAERFEEGGRSPLQARAVQLARMGTVVFFYDMIGYADSIQISFELAHRFAKQRPEMNTPENWGFYSPQAESHAQSIMGLQTWNSVRALDFMLTLPEVDPARIAVTGASGGGTQTMLLAAIDQRVALAVPAVMVSTAMQGGCTCENSSILRVNTGNIEFSALCAPRPQGLISANDWTKEIDVKGFPQLQQLYTLMGAPKNITLKHAVHFPHNYNHVSRAAMYSWVNQHFKIGLPEPVLEQDYKRLTTEELSVWNATHPKPAGGPENERKLVAQLTDDAQKQITAARKDPATYRALIAPAVEVIIGRTLATTGTVEWDLKHKNDRGTYILMSGLIRNKTHSEEFPALFLHPKNWNGRTVHWFDPAGKAALLNAEGSPRPAIAKLLEAGISVGGYDLFLQGEFLTDAVPIARTDKVKNPREFAGYTFGYNHSLFARRTHDILSAIQLAQVFKDKPKTIELVGLGQAGHWVAAARSIAGPSVTRAAIDSAGFRFSKLSDFHHPDFLAGGAKYDDLAGMLALNAPNPLWLAGEGDGGIIRDAYAKANAAASLTLHVGKETETAAIKWLLTPR